MGGWSASGDPFHKDAFIENEGQYRLNEPGEKVLFGADLGDRILFTRDGLVIKVQPPPVPLKEAEERVEEGKELRSKEAHTLRLDWKGASPSVKVLAKGEKEGYYTFGDAKEAKCKGYEKLIYKELYPGVDLIFEFPDGKGGLKYSLRVRPEGDLSDVTFRVEGAEGRIEKRNGNIQIPTHFGPLIDHAPKNSFLGDNEVRVEQVLEGNEIHFVQKNASLPTDREEVLLVDPWMVTPNYPTFGDSLAYDVDYDDSGNVYLSGGEPNDYHTVKYDPNGNFLWNLAWPFSWGYYSEFTVLDHSGSIFIGEGFSGSTAGPMVMKISTNGFLLATSPSFFGTLEIWMMYYNECTGQLIGFGGGTTNMNNLQLISDTSMGSSTFQNFNNATGGCCNDIADAAMEGNGDFYALISTLDGNQNSHDEQLEKVLAPNYNNLGFSVPSGYELEENYSSSIPEIDSFTVHMNIMDLNASHLFTYDGRTLKVWDKGNGNLLDSQLVDPSYTGSNLSPHQGIAVDECDRIYLGGDQNVHIYRFDGSNLFHISDHSNLITGQVYDIELNPYQDQLIVGGNGFTSVLDPMDCDEGGKLHMTAVGPSCDSANSGFIQVDSITGAPPPYEYQWSTGDTTASIDSLDTGSYSLTATAQACSGPITLDTTIDLHWSGPLTIDSLLTTPPLCSDTCAGSIDIQYSGASGPVQFSIDSGISFQPGSTFTSLCPGNYHVIVEDSSGCRHYEPITLELDPEFDVLAEFSGPSCHGDCDGSIEISTSGGDPPYQFSIDSGQSFSSDSLFDSLCAGTYELVVEDDAGCEYDTTLTLDDPWPLALGLDSVQHATCKGDSASISVSAIGGVPPYSFQWGPNTGNQTGTIADSLTQGSYEVVLTDSVGCRDTLSAMVGDTPPLSLSSSSDTSICYGDTAHLFANASGGYSPYTYHWSETGMNGTSNAVTPSSTRSYAVYVEDSSSCTTEVDTIEVEVHSPLSLEASRDRVLCGEGTATLVVNVEGGAPYSISWSNGMSGDSITVDPDSTQGYEFTVSSPCLDAPLMDSILVERHPNPDAEFSADTTTGCPPFEVAYENRTDSSMIGTCAWSFGDGDSSLHCYGVEHLYEEAEIFNVVMRVTSPEGCRDRDSVEVDATDCAMVVGLPNVFSPNGDGKNERFEPRELLHVEQMSTIIYNRWGQKILSTDDPKIGWEGENENGEPVPEGTYFWKVRALGVNGKRLERSGKVTLLR